MNAMSERDVPASQTQTVKVSDVAESTLLLDEFTFGPVLRCMRMDHHATRTRETGNPLEQLARTTDRKARRETISNTTIRLAMPPIEQRERLIDRISGLLLQSEWDFVALVHHALADRRTKAA